MFPAGQAPTPSEMLGDAFATSRPIAGSPVVWLAMRHRWLRWARQEATLAAAVILLNVYLAFGRKLGALDFHAGIIAMLLAPCLALLAVLSASSITAEKESGCWALLLATPLTDGRIAADKIRAALRRCAPGAALLGFHVVAFTAVGVLHPLSVACLLLLVAGATAFVAALGLYCSVRLRRTTTAVMTTLVVLVALWAAVPWMLSLPIGRPSPGQDLPAGIEAARCCVSPFVQLRVVVTSAWWREARFLAPGWLLPGAWFVEAVLLASAGHVLAAAALIWRAKARFRRHVFARPGAGSTH